MAPTPKQDIDDGKQQLVEWTCLANYRPDATPPSHSVAGNIRI